MPTEIIAPSLSAWFYSVVHILSTIITYQLIPQKTAISPALKGVARIRYIVRVNSDAPKPLDVSLVRFDDKATRLYSPENVATIPAAC
jgi:hypothetical protein